MLFTEPTFLFLFLPVLLALYFAQRGPVHGAYANGLLLAASVLFYAKGGGAFTWLMLGSIGFNYWMALAVDRARGAGRESTAALRLKIAVAINLVVLGVFKYANFFADNANALLTRFHLPTVPVPHVLLPIGISFFTFHAISYVIDVHRRDATAQKSPVHAALYLLLFPQLIAGPIIRYRDIADQLAERRISIDDFACGVRRFIIGLAKKVLIANVVAGPADAIFAMPFDQLSLGHAWLGIVCYTLQIYFDFSGYSDMAIGLGRMFGFRFPRISGGPTSPTPCRDSGGAGTSRCRRGSAITSTCRSAATASRRRGRTSISSRSSFCAASGTARAGRLSSGACGTACFS